jgi:ribosome-associated protein
MYKETIKRLAVKTARVLDNKKADNVKIYDLLGLSSLCDYMLIATAASAPHLEALEQEASIELKKENIYKSNRDGGNTGAWRVSDYGGFMLHIMTAAAREFYALDKVFSFGKEVKWMLPVPKTIKTKKTIAKKITIKKTAAKKTKKIVAKKSVKNIKKSAAKKTDKKKTIKKSAAKKPASKKIRVKKIKKTVKKVK